MPKRKTSEVVSRLNNISMANVMKRREPKAPPTSGNSYPPSPHEGEVGPEADDVPATDDGSLDTYSGTTAGPVTDNAASTTAGPAMDNAASTTAGPATDDAASLASENEEDDDLGDAESDVEEEDGDGDTQDGGGNAVTGTTATGNPDNTGTTATGNPDNTSTTATGNPDNTGTTATGNTDNTEDTTATGNTNNTEDTTATGNTNTSVEESGYAATTGGSINDRDDTLYKTKDEVVKALSGMGVPAGDVAVPGIVPLQSGSVAVIVSTDAYQVKMFSPECVNALRERKTRDKIDAAADILSKDKHTVTEIRDALQNMLTGTPICAMPDLPSATSSSITSLQTLHESKKALDAAHQTYREQLQATDAAIKDNEQGILDYVKYIKSVSNAVAYKG